MADHQDPRKPTVQHRFRCPPELEGGVYANMVGVWHTGHEFTIDFASSLPAKKGTDEGGNPVVVVGQKINARVKIAPTMLFEIIRALDHNLQKYEAQYGPVARPGQDEQLLVPPDDWLDEAPDDDGPGPGDPADPADPA